MVIFRLSFTEDSGDRMDLMIDKRPDPKLLGQCVIAVNLNRISPARHPESGVAA